MNPVVKFSVGLAPLRPLPSHDEPNPDMICMLPTRARINPTRIARCELFDKGEICAEGVGNETTFLIVALIAWTPASLLKSLTWGLGPSGYLRIEAILTQ
jgi:hypothetical protein